MRHDGFVKTKIYGRADVNNRWGGEMARGTIVVCLCKQKRVPQFSLSRRVTPEDEWIAEAYLETDYSSLDLDAFEKTVREYQAFKMENGL